MALILDNITLKEYYNLEYEERLEYDFALKYAKPFNKPYDWFNIGDFTELNFGLIKDLQNDFKDGLTWVQLISYIGKLTGKKEIEIGEYKLLDLSQFASYIKSEINKINEIETELLSHPVTAEEEEAGIAEFNKFGAYTQIRRLCLGDLTKAEQIKALNYSVCLLELYYQKTDSDFKEALAKIKTKK